ncbi:helix-turn-helix transcriptional regulator [Sphingopyxis panaciterrae]
MLHMVGGRSATQAAGSGTAIKLWLSEKTAPTPFQRIAAVFPVQAYALERARVEPIVPIDRYLPLGEPCHYRMIMANSLVSGSSEFCGLSDGFFVVVSDINLSEPLACAISTPDVLRIRVALDGDGEYLPSQDEMLDIRGRSAGVIIEPPNIPPAKFVSVGHHMAVQIIVHRDALQRLYPCDEQLPATIRAFLANELTHRVAKQLNCGPALLRCLEDLQNCSLTGRNRWLFIRSKAVEILCHTFGTLEEEDNIGLVQPSAFIGRAVNKAKDLLREHYVAPPSLDDLAREVGLSRTGLCSNFSRLTGQTVFNFVSELRMQHALAMLNRHEVPITEIAYAVGYNYPSSFTVAIQRRFGASPRELRRRVPSEP